ncbi:hypothetical protein SAMN04488601_10726 [Paenibacillus sp. 453mf]|nr:hypothetical protein SAMN04488601_10726 [Paenibacillus sp. 453mf]
MQPARPKSPILHAEEWGFVKLHLNIKAKQKSEEDGIGVKKRSVRHCRQTSTV